MIRLFFFFIIYLISSNNTEASIKSKILEKLEKINNLSFSFTQTISGKDEIGNCIIKYPKKIYCSYDSRFKKILVSNGRSLVIKTEKNKQYYLYSLASTPLNIILDKKFLINKFKDTDGKIINNKYFNFTIYNKQNEINIYFDIENYNLIGWQTEDLYQNLTVTFIYNLKTNTKINDKLFNLPEMY